MGKGRLSLTTRIGGCLISEKDFVLVGRGGRWDEKIPNPLGKLGLRGRSMLGTSGSLEQKEVWSSQR